MKPPRPLDDFWDELLSLDDMDKLPPEYQLLVAMVHRALVDYLSPDTPRYVRAEVSRWLFDEETHRFSLIFVCQYLSDDPHHLREQIRKAANTMTFQRNLVLFRRDR